MTAPGSLEAVIVLGSRLNAKGRPGRIGRMRLTHGLAVWREEGARAHFIITGGPTHGTACTEARAMADFARDWAEENGGPELRARLEACLVLEEASLNTAASARHCLALIRELDLKEVALISDALHLRRAHYLFRRHWRAQPMRLHPVPVPGVLRHYWQNRRYLWLTRMALRETGAWLKVLGHRALWWRAG